MVMYVVSERILLAFFHLNQQRDDVGKDPCRLEAETSVGSDITLAHTSPVFFPEFRHSNTCGERLFNVEVNWCSDCD